MWIRKAMYSMSKTRINQFGVKYLEGVGCLDHIGGSISFMCRRFVKYFPNTFIHKSGDLTKVCPFKVFGGYQIGKGRLLF